MNILAIGAHPDDIEFGCGGTLLKHKERANINMLIMSDGSKGGSVAVRKKEQQAAAKILNAAVFYGNYHDTQIPVDRKAMLLIEDVIKKSKPDLIFVHYPEDTHQDHRNTAQNTITATRYIKNVLFYEVPTSVNITGANVFVDITKNIRQKLKLLEAHKSQVFATRIAELSIVDAAKATATFNGYRNRTRFAESFVPLRVTLDCFYSND